MTEWCNQFPGLADLNSELYDDDVINDLINEGEQLFKTSSKDDYNTSTEDIFFPKGKPDIAHGQVKYIDAEVGDDLAVVANNWQYLCRRVQVLENDLDLKISWKDTSINSGLGNFSENLIRVPRKYSETWLSQKSLRRGETLGFIDVPKIRLMLPVRSQRMKFSSTDVGKFIDFGNIVSWTPKESPYYSTVHIGSLIQDTLLGAFGKKSCIYMPTDFGGAGKVIPFNKTGNFIRYISTWKTGMYKSTITTVIKQANRFLMSASTFGGRPVVPKLLEYFTKYEPVFTDWIKDDNVITAHRAPIPDALNVHQAGTLKYGDKMYWVLPRLLTEGHLISETKLQIALQHNALSKALVSEETFIGFKSKLKSAHEEWRKSQLLGDNVLKNEDFRNEISFYNGTGTIIASDVERFITSASNIRGFRRLIQSERVYWPEALHGVYLKGPMSLKGLFARPNLSGSRPQYVESWDYQADVPSTTEEIAGVQALLEWVKDPQGLPPREVIEDDDIIVSEIDSMESEKGVMIVTDDIRLCQRLASTGRSVLRIPVEWYYRCTYFGDGFNEAKQSEIKSLARITGPWVWFEDSGSIQSGEEKYFRDGEMFPKGFPKEILDHDKPWNSKPQVVDTPEGMDWDNIESPPSGFPDRYIFGQSRNLRRQGAIRKRRNPTHG